MAKASAAVMDEARKQLIQAAKFKDQLRKEYSEENKVPVEVSPMYKPYFGSVMRVAINGVMIYMPVDGTTHLVPQSFGDEIKRRRMAIDTMLTKQNRMADISRNMETAPGELNLF